MSLKNPSWMLLLKKKKCLFLIVWVRFNKCESFINWIKLINCQIILLKYKTLQIYCSYCCPYFWDWIESQKIGRFGVLVGNSFMCLILKTAFLFLFLFFFVLLAFICLYYWCNNSFSHRINNCLSVCPSFLWLFITGYYMYIETSRPRQKGDKARLLSPLYNVTAARGPSGSTRVPYCVSFFYHMNGRHIGQYHITAQKEGGEKEREGTR